MRHFAFLFFLFSFKIASSQTFYYVRPDINLNNYFGIFNIQTCQSTDLIQINTTGFPVPTTIQELAVSPAGDFFCIMFSFADVYIVKLDVTNNIITIIDTLPFPYNSLVCSAQNVLYLAGGFGFYSYDLNSGVGTNLGSLNFQPAGDLTFRDGKLYCVSDGISNDLVEININNPSQSVTLFNFPLPQPLKSWGVVSVVESCDSTTTYITATSGFDYQVNQVYLLDIPNQSITYLCDSPGPILGAATPGEFLASDCSVRLDLDGDSLFTNWQAPPFCSNIAVAICDSIATYYSGYSTDSIRVHLQSGLDVPFEYLSCTPTGSVNVVGQGTSWLTLSATPGTTTPTANADFQKVLRSIRWQDDALPSTAGVRTIEVIAFASGGRRDTAFAYLTIEPFLNAGRDTAVNVCVDAQSFDLSNLLDTNASAGGVWSPPTSQGIIFSPQNDLSDIFFYTVNNGACPADIATISVSVLPLPSFSLGQDTSICANEPIVLTVPSMALWQDGTNSITFSPPQSGLYWAEILDLNGCKFRDSIAVNILPNIQSQSTVQRCAGQPFFWNGYTFNSDTLICSTLTAVNGCDSTHCLDLTFFYPSLVLDTAICIGQPFNWLGNNYSTAGTYLDTVLIGSCLTETTLILNFQTPDTMNLDIVICDGESFIIGNQTFDNPGIYQQSFGCDSVVILQLNWWPATQPQITGDTIVCPGNTTILSVSNFNKYKWSGGQIDPNINVGAGSYAVTVTDIHGCVGSDLVNVTEWPPISTTWDTSSPLCYGGNDGVIKLTNISGGNSPFIFRLNNEVITDASYISNLSAGTWEIAITDATGCQTSFEVVLNDPPRLEVDLGTPPPSLESGELYSILPIPNLPGPFWYQWSPETGLSCVDCAQPFATISGSITYTLLISDANGCTAMDSLPLNVLKTEGVYVPNIFTPNGDGYNDAFGIYGDLNIVRQVESFRIYDRWGELIFESNLVALNDENSGWDGIYNGVYALPGVYVWYTEIRLSDGSLLRKSGEVTLIK